MPTVVHTVGIADLGLPKGSDVRAALRGLVEADVDGKRRLLIGARRSEPEHAAMSPLESLLAHVQMALPSDDGETRWELILVVTDQDSPDPNDTRVIGQAMLDVLGRDPAAFGHPVRPHLVTVSDMAAEAFAQAMTDMVSKVFIPQPVIVGIAGGPAIASLGVLGGLLNAGVKPSLIEANRQDRGFDVDVSLVTIDPDARQLLARSRQYVALAAEFSEADEVDQRALCKVLAAAVDGEWEATESRHSFSDGEIRQCARALAAPRLNGYLRKPKSEMDGETWGAWGRSLRRMIIHRVATDDELALALTDTFLHAMVNAELDGHSTDVRRCAEVIKTSRLAKSISMRITKRRWGPDIESVLHERNRLSVDEMATRIADIVAGVLGPALESAIKDEDLTPYEVVFDRYFRDHPELLPESLRPITMGIWRNIYDAVGAQARHELGSRALSSLRELLIEAGMTEDDDEDRAVRLLGLIPPPPLGSQGHLAIMCVGKSNVTDGDPMVDAVLEHLDKNEDVQILLVASGGERGTGETARVLHSRVSESLPGRCHVVVCEDSFGVVPVRRDLRDAFELLDLTRVRVVQVFVGPGTKAQNIGVAIAGVEISLELASKFELRVLSPMRNADGSLDMSATKVSPAVSASEGWKRIMPDQMIGHICEAALEQVDVDVWRTIKWISGSRWDNIVAEIRDLARFVETSLGQPKKTKTSFRQSSEDPVMDRNELLASRIQLIWKMRSAAPRTTVARAALTISDAFDDTTEDAWQRRGPATQILWGNRIAVLREPWAALRELPALHDILRELDLPSLELWHLSEIVDKIRDDISKLVNGTTEIDLVNMTPHPVRVISESGRVVEIPVCGTVPQVVLDEVDLTPPTYPRNEMMFDVFRLSSDVSELPDPDPRYILIVPRLVAEALPERDDLVFPDDLVRNELDVIIGCRRLSRIVEDSARIS